MAYNREWDQGKDGWADPSWNDYAQRGNMRGREEDYYSEGKRRKFNDGVSFRIGLSFRGAQLIPIWFTVLGICRTSGRSR